MPTWLTQQIGCKEIENPLKRIRKVLLQHDIHSTNLRRSQHEPELKLHHFVLRFSTEIKLNEHGTALSWVKLTFPQLDGLTIFFKFTGRTLIADADDLVHALTEWQHRSTLGGTPTKHDRSSLPRISVSTQRARQRMMTDPEVIRIRFFERNPDLAIPMVTPRYPTHEPPCVAQLRKELDPSRQ